MSDVDEAMPPATRVPGDLDYAAEAMDVTGDDGFDDDPLALERALGFNPNRSVASTPISRMAKTNGKSSSGGGSAMTKMRRVLHARIADDDDDDDDDDGGEVDQDDSNSDSDSDEDDDNEAGDNGRLKHRPKRTAFAMEDADFSDAEPEAELGPEPVPEEEEDPSYDETEPLGRLITAIQAMSVRDPLLLLQDDAAATLQQQQQQQRSTAVDLCTAFLDLKSPIKRFTATVCDFMLMPGATAVLMGFVSRMDTDASGAAADRNHSNDIATRRGYQVTNLLRMVDREAEVKRFVDAQLEPIVAGLFDTLQPKSKGSLYHFTAILQALLKYKPEETLDAFFALDTFHELVRDMSNNLHQSPISEAIVAIFEAKGRPTQVRKFTDALRATGFLTIVAQAINGENAATVATGFNHTLQALAGHPLARSLFLDSSRLESFCGSLGQTVTGPSLKTYEQSAAAAEILSTLFQFSQSEPATPLGSKPVMSAFSLASQRAAAVTTFARIVPNVCEKLKLMSERSQDVHAAVSHHSRKLDRPAKAATVPESGAAAPAPATFPAPVAPFTMLRLNLTRLLCDMVTAIEAPATANKGPAPLPPHAEQLLIAIPATTWKQLLNLLLEHRHNTVYHAIFFRLFVATLALNYEPTLRALLSNTKFVTRVIQHYKTESKDTSVRGIILLMLNFMRLTAQSGRSDYIAGMLHHHPEWNQFMPQLIEDTLRQQRSVISTAAALKLIKSPSMPTPYCGPELPRRTFVTPSGKLPSVEGLASADVSTQTASTLLDVGSPFALYLGFDAIVAKPVSAAAPAHTANSNSSPSAGGKKKAGNAASGSSPKATPASPKAAPASPKSTPNSPKATPTSPKATPAASTAAAPEKTTAAVANTTSAAPVVNHDSGDAGATAAKSKNKKKKKKKAAAASTGSGAAANDDSDDDAS